jgi:lysophospholipase L1-like esterase
MSRRIRLALLTLALVLSWTAVSYATPGYTVAIGDSITEGLYLTYAQTYPFLLLRSLEPTGPVRASHVHIVNEHNHGYDYFRTTHRSILNAGVSGENSTKVLARFYWDVVSRHPASVIIMVGTNDASALSARSITATTEPNVHKMVKMAQAAGIRPILAYPIPYTGGYKLPSAGLRRTLLAQLRTWMRGYAAAYRITLVDSYTPLLEPTTPDTLARIYTMDGVHLNAAGSAVLAAAMKKAKL